MHSRHGLTLSLLLLTAAAGLVRADVAADWDAGRAAWERSDFAAALQHFESARDAGLDTPAVHYNIAVSQYELGRYADAEATFALIAARFPQMRALAEYNLGLTADRQGEPAAARRHFLAAYTAAADDRNLRILASRRLRELGDETETVSAWSAAIGVRGGYDTNVALRDEAGLPAGTSTESPLFDLFATVQSPEQPRGGPVGTASAYVVRYPDAGDYDQAEVRVAGGYEWQSGRWRSYVGAQTGAGSIASDAFDRRLGVQARTGRPLGAAGYLDLAAQYDDVAAADDTWAGIAGQRWLTDVRYTWARDPHRLRLRYTHEANDREDPGVSPARDRVSADYRFLTDSNFHWELGIEYRDSRYDDLDVARDETLTTLRAAGGWSPNRRWLFLLELRGASNDSTDPAFDYDRNVLTLGAMRVF